MTDHILDTADPNVVETITPAEDLDRSVEFYTEFLGTPKARTESLVVFDLAQTGLELHLIVDDNKTTTAYSPHKYHKVKEPNAGPKVRQTHNALLNVKGAFTVLEPHEAKDPTSNEKILLSYVGYGDPCSIGDSTLTIALRIEGVIHNPNW